MKAIISIALFSFLAISCKKDRVSASDPIIGNWHLVLTTGGIGGIHQTPAQTGHTKSMAFLTNNTCMIKNDGIVSTTTFTIKDEFSQNYQQNVRMLTLNKSDKYNVYYVNDTMTLDMDGIVDGATEWYVKQQ